MMEKDKKYLSDILSAIALIEDFVIDIPDFQNYLNDAKTRSAVERQLAIIGEAVNKYLKVTEGNHLENARQIIAFRNWLVHAYDSIDQTTIWAILQKHLPALKNEASQKISS